MKSDRSTEKAKSMYEAAAQPAEQQALLLEQGAALSVAGDGIPHCMALFDSQPHRHATVQQPQGIVRGGKHAGGGAAPHTEADGR